ncbi:MAG: energy-coupling factor transporter transmembrane protein EcfT [Defluviitaleaceae bacterium]|nr:energy-coupling factor transporter transmembrane protein EcfT [Defluviitaleaceae bacterium]
MTRIIIGQYYPADSPIHRLDPRVKLLAVIAYVTVLIFVTNFYGLAVAALFLAGVIWLSRVSVRFVLRGLRVILFILSFAALINLLLTPGENVLFSFAFIRVTTEGIHRAAVMGARLVLLITGSSLLTLTTSPIQLTDGIEALLKPLRLPAHDIAIMMTIALRMIPTLAEELGKIMKAQKARGADFETGSPLKRIRNFLPILVPLFVSSFKRADELATAMEARCYRGGEGRTKLKPLGFTGRDALAGGVVVIFCVVLVLTRFI